MFIIDGSYSMGWEGDGKLPHTVAQSWAHHFLETLQAGDTVALLDARDQVREVIATPTRDFNFVREQLDALPRPSGSSDLAEAVDKATEILSRSNNLAREVIVLTDGQALPWNPDNQGAWSRIRARSETAAVSPTIWVADVSLDPTDVRENVSVDRLALSRASTVPGLSVRIRTNVRRAAGTEPVDRRVWLEVDGQQLQEQTREVHLDPNGTEAVEFEYQFETTGSHLVAVVADHDSLPGDDRADAVVTVADAIPVLLVDGHPAVDPTERATFFAQAALSAQSNERLWVEADVVPVHQFGADNLSGPDVVVLANVSRLSEQQTQSLLEFVSRGGGLILAPGDRADPDFYNQALYDAGNGPLPASLVQRERGRTELLGGLFVNDRSLQAPWLSQFRSEHDGGFTKARYQEWWRLKPVEAEGRPSTAKENTELAADGDESAETIAGEVVVLARLGNNAPLLVSRRFGRGNVLMMATPLDASWSTLPTKPDYVAFLHEAVFHLAGGQDSRNLDAGEPLVFPLPDRANADSFEFHGPEETVYDVSQTGKMLQLADTSLPGVYHLVPKGSDEFYRLGSEHPSFVVNFDRGESDLTRIDARQRHELTQNHSIQFVQTEDELRKRMFEDDSRSEYWHLLLLLFLCLLVGEVVLTRRLVKGGHEFGDPNQPHDLDSSES